MKKFLVTLLLMLPISAYALSVGVEHDVNVSAGGATIGVSQDGNEITVGTGGLTFSNSDTVDFGIAYSTSLLGGLEGGVSYDYTTDSDHVIGVDTTLEYWGLNFDTGIDWNVNDTDVSATIGTGYGILGVDGSVTSNWDVDDFSYEGLDIDAGYTWAVTDTFSVRPNVSIPFDRISIDSRILLAIKGIITFNSK